MENVSPEQIVAMGVIGFVVIGVAILFMFALMAGTLKLSIAWLGKSSPSYLACFGWLLAITFVNSFIIYGTLIVFGQTALILATPLTWAVTLYMLSSAANCGLIRAFGIWIVNSILATIGIVAIAFVMTIPLAIIGAGVQAGGENLQAEFDEMDQMMEDLDAQMEELEKIEIPETTNVGFQSPEQTQSQVEEQLDRVRSSERTKLSEQKKIELFEQAAPSRQMKPKSKPRRSLKTGSKKKARRAADGTTLNPFFQN